MRIGLARLKPSTDEWVDAAFVVATTGLSLIGFRRSFGGWDFLTAGLLGCVVAMLVAHLLHRWAVPMLLKFGLGALALLVFAGPVALRDEALAGVLPSPAAVFGVVDGLVSGWRRLLTTLPPSGSYGNLLAIPYVCGYLSGAIGITLSRSPKRVASLLLTSATVLVASLLFGTRTPFSVVLQGALYACAAIGWLAVRRSRDHRRYLVAVGPKRLIAASAMLAVVGSLGLVVGPRLPFAEASERFVLRDRTEPPFDPRSFGSPLNAFQRYLVGPLKDVDLFHIDGIPADVFDARSGTALVRLAVLDEYDGVVWQVSPGGGSVASERSGRFVRVGDEIPRDAMGETATITVAVMGLPGVWLPDLGTVTGVSWGGDRADRLREAMRMSLATSTGLVPVQGGLQPGDEYTFRTVIPATPDEAELAVAAIDAQAPTDFAVNIPSVIVERAAGAVQGVSGAYRMAAAIETMLHDGYYASGDAADGQDNAPGHSLRRLMSFLGASDPVGNAEQYAAAMAVMARSVGLPARVVMGFRVDETGIVTGSDVHAWVEIGFESGWVPFDPTATSSGQPENRRRQPQPQYESQDVPPPPVLPPDADVNPNQKREGESEDAPPDLGLEDGGSIPAWVVAALVAVGAPVVAATAFVGLVVWTKRRRRQRRREAADPARQVAGGWEEYLDQARDVGRPVPSGVTRREVALVIGAPSAPELAYRADCAIFDRRQPTADEAEAYWDSLDAAVNELHAALTLRERFRAAASLTSVKARR